MTKLITDQDYYALKEFYTVTDCEITIIDQTPEPEKKWEPVGGDRYVSVYGTVYDACSSKIVKLAGCERTNEEDAKRLAKRRLINERLSALACELGGEEDFVTDKRQYTIVYSREKAKYIISNDTNWERIGAVYMNKECADKIIKMLNSGEVVL